MLEVCEGALEVWERVSGDELVREMSESEFDERKRESCWGLLVPQAPKDAAKSAVAKSTRAGGKAFIGVAFMVFWAANDKLVAKAGGDSMRVGTGFGSIVSCEAVCIEDGPQTLDGF